MITEEALRIAQAMPDYDVERELGRGGMGVVYLARHKRLDRGVAIKELPSSFASEPEVRERFSTEARTLATLAHPHIVPIFDYVERDGLCLIVMEQLPGGTVWDRFTSTGLTPPTACAVVMACCAALQHAHGKGVLHLDVKPDNLMFDSESAVKVTDFGIAKVISGDRTLGTVDGQVLGTPAYMSPEQARGDELTPASDVYAAGVMLYELLTGQLPWEGAETAAELLAQRLEEDPIALQDVAPQVAPALAVSAMRALSRDVDGRYERADDFGVAIGEACARSWGPDWLAHAGVAIVGSERISLAARTTGFRAAEAPATVAATTDGAVVTTDRADERVTGAASAVPGAAATGVVGRAGVPGAAETGVVGRAGVPGAAETGVVGRAGVPGAAAPEGEDEPTSDGGHPAQVPVFEVVRAASAEPRIKGADLHDLELADLIGVQDILDPPKPPWRSLLLTALLFATALLVAIVGIGEPDRDATLASGQVALGGVDVAAGSRIALDLSGDVVVTVTDPSLARTVDEAAVRFSVLGIPLGSADAPLRAGVASIDPGLAQRTAGGAVTATVVLTDRGEVVREHEVGVDATQQWYLTAGAVLGALVLLLAYANLESSFKPLRSGHPRFLSSVGATVAGATAGIGLVALATSLGFAEPTVPAVAAVVLLGAASGLASARARVVVARRQRVRRAVKRAERALGVRI